MRCRVCHTLVEVPFFPRVVQSRRKRKRWTPLRLTLVLGAVLLTGLTLALGSRLVARGVAARVRAERARELTREIEAARSDATQGLAGLERALPRFNRAIETATAAGLDITEAQHHERDALALSLATARLDALPSRPGDDRLNGLREIARDVGADPALRGLEDRVAAQLETVSWKVAEAALSQSREALANHRHADALSLARQANQAVSTSNPAHRKSIVDSTNDLARQVAREAGVRISAVDGQNLYGEIGAYRTELSRLSRDAFVRKGYIPRETAEPWQSIWDEQARFHLSLSFNETAVPYLSSALSGTRIEADLDLTHAGGTSWRTHVMVQTRMPPPGMGAYEASRYATTTHRTPEAERHLYDDAREQLANRLTVSLNGLPPLSSYPPP